MIKKLIVRDFFSFVVVTFIRPAKGDTQGVPQGVPQGGTQGGTQGCIQ